MLRMNRLKKDHVLLRKLKLDISGKADRSFFVLFSQSV